MPDLFWKGIELLLLGTMLGCGTIAASALYGITLVFCQDLPRRKS